MHKSVLRYHRAKWLKVATLLAIATIVIYAWHNPLPVANGGTWLGYTLGTIGALLILWLAWFGVRKRSYKSKSGTVQGWLSAHVYLGSALTFIGTFHTGFQFGWNVHTLAYVLMCLVIASGIFGIVVYVRYPKVLSDNRRNSTQAELLTSLKEIDQQLIIVSNGLSDEYRTMIDSSVELTALGGNLRRQLSATDYSKVVIGKRKKDNPDQRTVIKQISDLLGDDNPDTNAQARRVIQTLSQRSELLQQLRKDIRTRAMLDIWLLVHIPATVALITSLAAHVFIVFYYW